MAGSTVVLRDRGYQAYKRNMEAAAKRDRHVKIGFLTDGAQLPDAEINMAHLATIHEFGTVMVVTAAQAAFMRGALGMGSAKAGDQLVIPERSFMRSGMDEGRPEIRRVGRKLGERIAAESHSRRAYADALGILGLLGERLVKAKITQGPFEPLSPVTIAQRKKRSVGSNRPLLDTGQMRNAISHQVVL